MASWFEDEAESLRSIIHEYGEAFTLTPYAVAQVNFTPTRDLSRPVCEFDAIFDRQAKDVNLGLGEVRVSTRDPCITAMACDIPYETEQGDRLTHKLTGEEFEITDSRPDGLSGVEFRVVQVGRASR